LESACRDGSTNTLRDIPGSKTTLGVRLHFTPAECSWLNVVEVLVSIITHQAIWRDTFTSVRDLLARIGQFINGWTAATTAASHPSGP